MAGDIEHTVYHVAAAADVAAARDGAYAGSALCRRDGFIHMSTAAQLAGTLARFFAGRGDLVLLELEVAVLAPRLRWEAVPGAGIFPHYYGTLSPAQYRVVGPLALGAGGLPALPSDLAEAAT